MTVKIRLKRVGRNKLPQYSIIISDSRNPRDGKYISKIGMYNPIDNKDSKLIINKELFKYWISNGAQPTKSLLRILLRNNSI